MKSPLSYKQNDEFAKMLRDNGFDTADWVLEWVASEFYPEDVYIERQLAEWAEENGYVLKGDN